MNSFLLFIIVLGVLITFHELGHFLIARLCGVGVERFSIGFGPRIFGKTVGRTDYRLSLVPLGGYVKMVGDDPEAPLEPKDKPFSFNHKSVTRRSLIVFAGPFFNFLLAILIYFLVYYFSGITTLRPVIRNVEDGSPAMEAGLKYADVISGINGKKIGHWNDIRNILDKNQGEALSINVVRDQSTFQVEVKPKLVHIQIPYLDEISKYDIGIEPFLKRGAVISAIVKDSPAAKAKLQSGDQIVSIDGKNIDRWETMQKIVSGSKGETQIFEILRDGKTVTVPITPAPIQERDIIGVKKTIYRIGIISSQNISLKEDEIKIKIGFFQSIGKGFEESWYITKYTGIIFVRLIQGKMPKEAIGGPIRIAQMASKEAAEGLNRLLRFIAMVSVSLAVFNLVPIPVLDGGHLLFFAIEAVQRKPVSLRTREMAQQVGVFILILLFIFIIYNDIRVAWF
ncbi:MAG: RIP metalloprotease RseP [Desulfobacteraceae bacterium]|nr:RIP metalloprotease RseP [Desulfobacteraceae bacterium]